MIALDSQQRGDLKFCVRSTPKREDFNVLANSYVFGDKCDSVPRTIWKERLCISGVAGTITNRPRYFWKRRRMPRELKKKKRKSRSCTTAITAASFTFHVSPYPKDCFIGENMQADMLVPATSRI